MNEYYSSGQPELSARSTEMKDIDRATEVGIEEFGTTTNPFEHQTNALKARIFHGANRVEFAFFGQQKGRKEQPTPETFGKRERQDMRELADFNKVETTTHATVGVSGLSGLDMRQGVFDDRQRKESMEEIKRAIHFAAQATTGGAVVFHTGEAPRYMHGRNWDDTGVEFEMYPEEAERKVTYLADPHTKRLVAQVSGVDKIAIPILKRQNGNFVYLKDENDKDVVDEQLAAVDRIHKGRIPLYETTKDGDMKTKLITFNEFKNIRGKEYQEIEKRKPSEEELVKDFFYQQKFVDVMYSLYFGIRSEREYDEYINQRDKIKKSLKFYRELKEKVPESEWWKYKEQFPGRTDLHFVPTSEKDPVDYLEKAFKENERHIAYSKELALHGRRTALEQLDIVQRSKLADEFAVGETAKSMAEIGEYAWMMTNKAHKDYKDGKANYDIKNPIYIAPENLFPETYGSHPDELKKLVIEGRKAMAKRLKSNYGMKEDEAEKLAKEHIRATFDIGHANIWRKYFVGKPGESLDQRDKRFNKWLLKKTKTLLKEGIIGHIHVSDNFGFHDEHLTAGDGNTPIKEFIEQAKKEGFDEFIVESGSFNPMTSLPDTWMHFDSPVYAMHMPGITPDRWTDPSSAPQHGWSNFFRSYFGKTEGPRYVVGDYAPSEDFKGAPFYTGVGLE